MVQIFSNPDFGEIRTVEVSGEPMFVGKDVATALGYKDSVNALKSHVDEEDKRGWQITTPYGEQQMTIISESGLYSLILSSKLDGAKKFKKWVTSEVLPSIRKHGAYATETTIDNIIANPAFGIQLLTALQEERKEKARLEAENKKKEEELALANNRANILSEHAKEQHVVIDIQKERINVLSSAVESMEKKVSYVKKILQCKSTVKVKVIAQDYGMSAKAFNQLLHSMGVQYKEGESWFLYQRYKPHGYVKDVPFYIESQNGQKAVSHMQWTQKGRMFLYDFLKSNGILPLIEQ